MDEVRYDVSLLSHDELHELTRKINERKAYLDELAEAKLWPKIFDLYLHNSKDNMYDVGNELGLTDEALSQLVYTCYEVCITLEVSKDGTAYATHFENVPLTEKIKV